MAPDTSDDPMDAATAAAVGEGACYLHHPPNDPHLPIYNYTFYYPPTGGDPTQPASVPCYLQPVAGPPSYVKTEGVRRGEHMYSAQPVQYYRDPSVQDGQFVASHAVCTLFPFIMLIFFGFFFVKIKFLQLL